MKKISIDLMLILNSLYPKNKKMLWLYCLIFILLNSLQSTIVAQIDSNINQISEKIGLYTAEEWQTVIDTTWGEGLPTETKLQIFDEYWKYIDEQYPSFHNINVNWDSLRNVLRPEVVSGTSRGRFYAIMSQLFFSLRDFHVRIVDSEVAQSELKLGTPILVPWGYWEVGHFGAALAPTPDSSLFIYKVVDNHPLGLEVGDIILGYDGIQWKDLYQKMYEVQFPLAASMNSLFKKAAWGTALPAYTHIWLCSAGMNWHLFNTIDVVKYSTKDTVHLSTSLLENQNMSLIATAQMPIPGVQFPDIQNGHSVSWGKIEGTNIGYIYNYSWQLEIWPFSPGDEFRDALIALKNDDITGLIIDARTTEGGYPSEFQKIYPLLFNQDWDKLSIDVRSDPNDHYAMRTIPISTLPDHWLPIEAEDDFFDHPIAVLTGPSSASAADIFPLVLKSHPLSRLFGLPTNGALSGLMTYDPNKQYGTDSWEEWLPESNLRYKDSVGSYLTHIGYPIDETLWLTQEDVVHGDDTVVKRALEWIKNLVYPHDVKIDKTYIHPQNDSLKISAIAENPNHHPIYVTTYISSDNNQEFLDSLNLNEVADSIWAATWSTSKEDFYNLSVKTVDPIDSTSRTIPNVVHFTTAGPIKIDSIECTPYTNNRYIIKTFIKNESASLTLNDVQITPYSDDLWVTQIYPTFRSCTTISPGEIKTNIQPFAVSCDSASFPGYFNLKFDMSIDGRTYWTDTVKVITLTVGIDDLINQPLTFMLEQNYPNPFNPSTKIKYSLPHTSIVIIKIFDVLGNEIETLLDEEKPAGTYELNWNAANQPSGVYFYRLQAGSFVETKKMILLK